MFLPSIPPRILIGAGLVLALVALGWWLHHRGYRAGVADTRAQVAAELRETQERLFKAADSLSESEARLRAAQAQQDDLARRIEDEARADTGTCRTVSADSLRRLRRRWGAAD